MRFFTKTNVNNFTFFIISRCIVVLETPPSHDVTATVLVIAALDTARSIRHVICHVTGSVSVQKMAEDEKFVNYLGNFYA